MYVEDTSLACLKQNQFVLFLLWSHAHLALASPCDKFYRFEILVMYIIAFKLNFKLTENFQTTTDIHREKMMYTYTHW